MLHKGLHVQYSLSYLNPTLFIFCHRCQTAPFLPHRGLKYFVLNSYFLYALLTNCYQLQNNSFTHLDNVLVIMAVHVLCYSTWFFFGGGVGVGVRMLDFVWIQQI